MTSFLTFQDCLRPFVACATNVHRNESIRYIKGPIIEAVLASTALIRIFPYRQRDDYPGEAVADGTYSDNMPNGVAKEYGEYIISNNVSPLVTFRFQT